MPTPFSWPRKITVHTPTVLDWMDDGEWRVCPFCRSLHPGDVLSMLQTGYDIDPVDHEASVIYAGFNLGRYTFRPQHLYDEGYADGAWETLVEEIYRRTSYWFMRETASGGAGHRWGRGVRPK